MLFEGVGPQLRIGGKDDELLLEALRVRAPVVRPSEVRVEVVVVAEVDVLGGPHPAAQEAVLVPGLHVHEQLRLDVKALRAEVAAGVAREARLGQRARGVPRRLVASERPAGVHQLLAGEDLAALEADFAEEEAPPGQGSLEAPHRRERRGRAGGGGEARRRRRIACGCGGWGCR